MLEMSINKKAGRKNTAVRSILKDVFKKRQLYYMLLPNVILFSLLSIYPIMWALQYMFFSYDGIYPAKFTGLDNFARVFTRDPVFWTSVVTTFKYVIGKLIFTVPIAFILALILNKKFFGSSFFRAVIFSPTIMSAAVIGMIFYLLFNAYNGEINRILLNLNIIHEPINWLGKDHSLISVIILGAWGGIGNYMIYFLSGLQNIPNEIYESANLDGVNAFQRVFLIEIPMMGPVLKFILMLAIVIAFQDMQGIMVLTEGGPVQSTLVMFLYVYQLYFPISVSAPINPEYGYGAAVCIVSAAIVGVITLIYLYFARKLDDIY